MKYSIQRRRFVSDPPVQMSPTTIACVNKIRSNGTNEIGSDVDPNIAVATSAPGTQAMPAEPRLLDRLRGATRIRHYSIRTEATYVDWARRFILGHMVINESLRS